MSKNYNKIVLLMASVVLMLSATLNYFVDPAGIYGGSKISPDLYAKILIGSKYGLLWPEGMFDERSLVKALAKQSGAHDCVVIGSSRVMQISSVRAQRSLKNECANLINLGASGASLEDHFALAYLATRASLKNQKVILGIDPWTLTHNKDARWREYRDDYELARAQIFSAKKLSPAKKEGTGKILNLVNYEYTVRSIKSLYRLIVNGPLEIREPETKVNENIGVDVPLKLQDGSHIYSSSYIKDSEKTPIPFGGSAYATNTEVSSKRGVTEYTEFLRWLIRNGDTPILLMTPYHHNVWKGAGSPNVLAMNKTEKIVMEIGRSLGLRVIGSFRPELFGCTEDEFYDFMHPKAECLSRLKERAF